MAPTKTPSNFRFDATNPRATAWAKKHAGELVSGVSKTTRENIRDAVEGAFEDQYDVHELADRILNLLGDASRAETIARTETMRAANAGQQETWDQAADAGLLIGDEKKVWLTTPDELTCPVCEPLDGQEVGLDENFDVDGEALDGPPAHPNCRCTTGLAL